MTAPLTPEELEAMQERAEAVRRLSFDHSAAHKIAGDVLALLYDTATWRNFHKELSRDYVELQDERDRLAADNLQLESIRKDLLAIIKDARRERDRLSAENAKLRAVADEARDMVEQLDDECTWDLRQALAALDQQSPADEET